MKKLLSTLLALTMIFACVTPVFADDGDTPRDTDFFTEQPHTDLNFEDIEYEYVDPAPLIQEAKDLVELAADPANLDEFVTRFTAFKDDFYHMLGMWYVLSIRCDLDYTDTESADEYEKVYADVIEVDDAFSACVRDVLLLDNACSHYLKSILSEDDLAYYTDFTETTQEMKDLLAEESALETEYETVAHTTYTTTIDGVEYDADGVYDAFFVDEVITLEQYLEGCRECYGPYGELYLKMIAVRNKIAQLNGYDNYADYAYAEVYNRDYTVEDIDAFRSAVKKYLAPALAAYRSVRPSIDTSALPLDDSAYSGEGMFDVILPLFAQMSDELLESATRMHDQGFYDISAAEEKADRGYSMMLPYYNMPFYYNYPYGNLQDLLTTIHELGHNNKSYWSPNDWTDASPSSNKDLAETHSQGLELLMTNYYDQIFGDQKEEVLAYETYNILSSIISGCLHDEIQCYAYSTPNVTFEMICQKYRQLAEEYGNVGADDPRPEMYGWTSVHHTFNSAMYYISYATSAAGAFMFWNEAQDDFLGAVDHYLEFCAQSAALGFEETYAAVGLESPLSPEYIQKLSKTVRDKLFYVDPFTDVYADQWYAMGVYFAKTYGLMNGTTTTTYSPAQNLTKGQILTVLARLAVQFQIADSGDDIFNMADGIAWAVEAGLDDDSNLDAPVTRENFAILMCKFYELVGGELEVSADLSDFVDADKVSADAVDAMTWMVENGILTGTTDSKGTVILDPQGVITRGQFATLLYRFAVG